jgi:hypothetical protein
MGQPPPEEDMGQCYSYQVPFRGLHCNTGCLAVGGAVEQPDCHKPIVADDSSLRQAKD